MKWLGSNAAEKQVWNPSLSFFRQKCVEIELEGRCAKFSWAFELIKSARAGFLFIKCLMNDGQISVCGQGYAAGIKSAMTQAFAEAWERLWVHRLARTSRENSQRIISSNGFAAGATNQAAIDAAKGELIERALLLRAWQTKLGWFPVTAKSLPARFMVELLAAKGWKTQLYRIEDCSIGAALGAYARHRKGGSIFDTIYLPGRVVTSRLETKALRSIMRSVFFDETVPESWNLPENGSPKDHAIFYRNPDHNTAFDFLDNQPREYLELGGGDLTTVKLLHRAGEMPAVAFAQNPTWDSLSWGRQSIKGDNPWPHPLA